MKKKVFVIVSIVMALCCITGIIAGAVATATTETAPTGVTINKDKIYYAYFNLGSNKGAVAFCLDNKFADYGATTDTIKLCSKNVDGTYQVLYAIDKEYVTTWFAGRTDYSISTGDEISSLLGGLDSIGITLDSAKTNVGFELMGQSISANTQYAIYIPEGYFVDESGASNAGGYVEIEAEKVNGYTGDLMSDLKSATGDLYDFALKGFESVNSIQN